MYFGQIVPLAGWERIEYYPFPVVQRQLVPVRGWHNVLARNLSNRKWPAMTHPADVQCSYVDATEEEANLAMFKLAWHKKWRRNCQCKQCVRGRQLLTIKLSRMEAERIKAETGTS
jgi:hypothetical protein